MKSQPQQREAPEARRRIDLAYVLVCDSDVRRAAACLDALEPFNVGVLIARDGEEAIRILEQFGPPVLLITELSLPRRDGFSVIEALRRIDRRRTEVIAWSSFRELAGFAARRRVGLNVRTVLRGAVSPAALREAIDKALRNVGSVRRFVAIAAVPDPEAVQETSEDLARRARALSGCPGVALYLSGLANRFHASVTWTASEASRPSPFHLPRVFEWILESGDALVLPDLSSQPLSTIQTTTLQDVVRGLIGVPILSDSGEIIGALCVFDVQPLVLDEAAVGALKAIGQGVSWTKRVARAAPKSASDAEDEAASGVLDRRGGDLAIARELARARRQQGHLSVVLFDVDPAPRIVPGGNGGARDPRAAAEETLTRAIRGSDLAIRWTREELLVVLPGLSETEARQVAERVRAAMQVGSSHRAAVAGGVAEITGDETIEAVIARAYDKVRLAREQGHNRIG